MSGARSVVDFVGRYSELAGRFCCSGKSWSALDRTLQRYDCETSPAENARETRPAESDLEGDGQEPAVTLAAENVRS